MSGGTRPSASWGRCSLSVASHASESCCTACMDTNRSADLVRQQDPETEPQTGSRAVDDLVEVAEFRDLDLPGAGANR